MQFASLCATVATSKNNRSGFRWGWFLQDPFLFAGTIADNIRFGRLEATEAEREAAAPLANAHEIIYIYRAPAGSLRDPDPRRGVNVSLGQRQLLCIGRAILADPRILIFDEAMAIIIARRG